MKLPRNKLNVFSDAERELHERYITSSEHMCIDDKCAHTHTSALQREYNYMRLYCIIYDIPFCRLGIRVN